jgi:hypothetical protein
MPRVLRRRRLPTQEMLSAEADQQYVNEVGRRRAGLRLGVGLVAAERDVMQEARRL